MKFSSTCLFAAIVGTPFISTLVFADSPVENQGNDNGLHPLVENQGNDNGLHPTYPMKNQGNDDGLHPDKPHHDKPVYPVYKPHHDKPKYKKMCTVNTDNTRWDFAYVRATPCNNRHPLDTLFDGDTVYSTGKTKFGCGYRYTQVWDSNVNMYGWVASMFLDCRHHNPHPPVPVAATYY